MNKGIVKYGTWQGKWNSPLSCSKFNGDISFTYTVNSGDHPSVDISFLGSHKNNTRENFCGIIKNKGMFDKNRLNIFVTEEKDNQFEGQLFIPELSNQYILTKCKYVKEEKGEEELCFCSIL